jgi:D-sedoheptulose 7-phosphate isomerase
MSELVIEQVTSAKIQNILQASIDVKAAIVKDEQIIETVSTIAELIVEAFQGGNKVMFCGNGGSAADAQHLAAEFSGRFYKDRDPLPAEALHVNTSYMTAVANDYSYNEVYSRIVKGSGKAGDVLIGLSTSGNSANIIAAFEQARKMGIKTVGFTGDGGGKMKAFSDFLVAVPSSDTPRIQESHITLGHIVCQLVEESLF